MNSRQENHSKFSFYSQILRLNILRNVFFLENIAKGFLKFCKLTRPDHRLKSYKRVLNCHINCARLHENRYIKKKKKTSNTIITQTCHSRYSSWKLSSKAGIAWDFWTLLRIKQGEKRKRCHPKSGFRLWQATHLSTKNPINKLAMNNRILLIAAVFHFVHPVEKTVKNITSWHKTLLASAVKVKKFQDAA